MFLFPTGEWLAWNSNVVMLFILWLYGVWVMGRRVLGPILFQGGKGSLVTVVGALFLMVVVTFLMSFTPVNFPSNPSARVGQLPLHVRAMWILFIAVNAYSIPVGYLSARLRALTAVKEEEEAEAQATEALEIKRSEAESVAGEEIQVKADYRVMHLPLSAIRYIEGRNNYACFHLDHRKDVVSQISLKSVMDMLPEGKFARIHRSYIVPLWRIEHRTSAGVQLLGVEEMLPIGRAYKDNLKNA